MEPKFIRIIGARQHNLQDISLDLPRDRLVVITGLSGSGKSSLAFDTIYAEGQRKYVESLSVHARHFLEQISKPDVERIEGLPPTLAIEQRATASNPRSTVATTTEIYDFLRVLFARVGLPHCPKCGQRIHRRTVDQIVDIVMSYGGEHAAGREPPGIRVMVMAPLARGQSGELQPILRRIQREGFVRARVNGRLHDVKELTELPKSRVTDIDVVVDRLVVHPDVRSRLADAVELSLRLGDGTAIVARANGSAAPASHNATTGAEHAASPAGGRRNGLGRRGVQPAPHVHGLRNQPAGIGAAGVQLQLALRRVRALQRSGHHAAVRPAAHRAG